MSSNRLRYDTCTYKTDITQSSNTLNYMLDKSRYENCNQCRMELGIVGGIFIILVFSNLTKALLSIKKYDRNLLYLNLSITLSVLIFSLFHNNLTNYVFWILTLYPLIYKKLLKI